MVRKENVKFFLTVAGLLLSTTVQHFISPPTWCELAAICNHTMISGCAQENNLSKRIFLDECDMFEYNCDNRKEYLKVDMMKCSNTLSSINGTHVNVSLTTLPTITMLTISSSSDINNKITSAEKNITVTHIHLSVHNTPSDRTKQINKSLTPFISNISYSIIDSITTPLTTFITNNYTRNQDQSTGTKTFESISSTTPLPIANFSKFTLSQTTTFKIPNVSIFSGINNVTRTCTRNSTQITTSKSLASAVFVTVPIITNATVSFLLSTNLPTSPITPSVINVIKPPVTVTNPTMKVVCTRHKQLISYITKSKTLATLTSTIKNEPAAEMQQNCTRNSAYYKTTTITTSNKNSSGSSTDKVSHSIITTEAAKSTLDKTVIPTTIEYEGDPKVNSDKAILNDTQIVQNLTGAPSNVHNLVQCKEYPKECGRPSTWETTARGETRDFFQILRAKFGTRARFLKATTHWPLRLPLIVNDDTFVFGRHHES